MLGETRKKAAVSMLAAALLLSGCSNSSAPEPPLDYALGEDSLPSLSSLVTLDSSFQFQESASEDEPDSVTYVYSQLSNGGETAEQYTKALEEDYNCTVSTGDTNLTAPDFSAASGQALVFQSPDGSDECFRLTVQWEETSCSVTPSLVPKDEIPQTADEAENSVTVEEAVAHMEGLSPPIWACPAAVWRSIPLSPRTASCGWMIRSACASTSIWPTPISSRRVICSLFLPFRYTRWTGSPVRPLLWGRRNIAEHKSRDIPQKGTSRLLCCSV